MKLLIICGKSCSGKNTLMNQLLQNYPMTSMRVVSYTTRPKRKNEVNRLDYNFVTDEQFDQMLANDDFINVTSYDVNGKHWRYAFSKESFTKYYFTNILIANPQGVFDLCKHFKYHKIEIIYLKEFRSVLKKRYLARGGSVEDYNARALQDDIDFKDFVRKARTQGLKITPMRYSFRRAEIIYKRL